MGNVACTTLSNLSKEDVACAVSSHGSKYEAYADAVRDNGIDGEILASLAEEEDELSELFDELEIKSKLHRRVLAKSLTKAKKEEEEKRSPQQSLQNHSLPTVVAQAVALPENLEYFLAAAEYRIDVNTPRTEVLEFEKIAETILRNNPKATFASVNLILHDAQHPIGTMVRQPDGNLVPNRKLAYLKNKDSVCYYLVHGDATKDVLIRDLPPGNGYGADTYLGHVIKDNTSGARIGSVCQVANLTHATARDAQILFLKKLALNVEEELLKRKAALLTPSDSLEKELEHLGDSIILSDNDFARPISVGELCLAPPSVYPSSETNGMLGQFSDSQILLSAPDQNGFVAPITVGQFRSSLPFLHTSPEDVNRLGKRRDSSKFSAYDTGVSVSEDDFNCLPLDLLDKTETATSVASPTIDESDTETTPPMMEALELHKMDPDCAEAATLRNYVSRAAQHFRFPLAQISFNDHAKEFSFCPFSAGLTKEQEKMCSNFVDDVLIRDSKGYPFIGSRGSGSAMCNYAIITKRTFVVQDLWEDDAFALYRDMNAIRSYVGCPILSADGNCIALLCMCDFKARPDFDRVQELQAESVAQAISQTIENWALRQEVLQLEQQRRRMNQRHLDHEKRSPPKGDVTFVFTDIQGSTQLWETDAALMESAQKVHDEILRKCCFDAYGYEITTEGDAFLLAFHDPIDAISFALKAQMELHLAPWPDSLYSHPAGANDSKNAIRGVRVRMGIHRGEVTTREHEVTGRIRYLGETVRITKSTEDMCHGGQILVTMDAWRTASSMMDSLGSPQVLDLGEHILTKESSASNGSGSKRILQLVPKDLAFDYLSARRNTGSKQGWVNNNAPDMPTGRRFPRVKTIKKVSPSFHDAPYIDSQVSMTFVYSLGLEKLIDEVAEATLGAIGKALRSLLDETGGYECQEDRGLWMLAFHNPTSAVKFGLSLLSNLKSTQTLSDDIDRDSLVKVGVHSGTFKSMGPHPTTGRADYFGPVVNRAARVAAAAGAGQVYIGQPVAEGTGQVQEDLVPPPPLDPSILTYFVGVRTLKGVSEPMALFSCVSPNTVNAI